MTDQMERFREIYRRQLPERLEALRTLAATPGGVRSMDFRAVVHGFAGSAGTFGFHDLSAVAIPIDNALAAKAEVSAAEVERLARAVEAAISMH